MNEEELFATSNKEWEDKYPYHYKETEDTNSKRGYPYYEDYEE